MAKERLQKVLAAAGVASRRSAETAWITLPGGMADTISRATSKAINIEPGR